MHDQPHPTSRGIDKVLIANRGEIALRVMKTCRRMGIATVAVFSDADAAMPFVRFADEAVRLGPAPASESYLVIERILDAARLTGADAIHPGYGFLAENADFAEAVDAAGLIWIGPPAEALRLGGDKLAAKKIAAEASVPVVPTGEPDEIGFPLLVKAAAGGGGRGMRIVREPAELDEALGGALVTAHPISIDPDEFTGLAGSDAVLARERELIAARPETMILRVDRTDPSKNVVRGFEAFGLLLERRPDLRGRVGMLALLDPSRQEIPEYVEELQRIQAAAASLAERFPGALETRVSDDFPHSIAAYKQFDVLLVNAIMDGLNLVAKEAPLVNDRDGVLVLSRQAGAFAELGEWALGVDPLDVDEQADALARAIALPAEERRAWLAAIQARVRAHDLAAWADRELAELDARTR